MDERYMSLRYLVSTRDGFSGVIVRRHRWWEPLMRLGALGFGVMLLLNVVSGAKGEAWWASSPWLFAVVLCFSGWVGLQIHDALAHSRVRAAFKDFEVGGRVAVTCPTGVLLPVGSSMLTLVLLADVDTPQEVADGLVARLKAALCVDDKSVEARLWLERIAAAGTQAVHGGGMLLSWSAISAERIDSSFPVGVWLMLSEPTNEEIALVDGAPASGGTRPVLVVPNGTDNITVFPVKRSLK